MVNSRILLLAFIVVLSPLQAYAQQATGDGFNFRLGTGGLFYSCGGLNEHCTDSTVDDPPKIRGGVVREKNNGWGRGLLAISGDRVRPGTLIRDELVLQQFKESEDDQKVQDNGGEWYLGVKKPGDSSTDADMIDAIVLNYRQGVRFNLPIYAPNLTGGGVATSFLQAGRYQLHLQTSDGNFVLYEVVGTTFCPRWAITWLSHNGTGYIDPIEAGLPVECRR